eukprot:scaffold3271_cov60-Phaeocystis_antarctica.AAC.4
MVAEACRGFGWARVRAREGLASRAHGSRLTCVLRGLWRTRRCVVDIRCLNVRECECCVHERAVVTWRDHEQEWSLAREEGAWPRGMPW